MANSIIISKRMYGGFLLNVNGFQSYTNVLNYRTGSNLELYDSIGKLVGSGSSEDFTINTPAGDVTGFTTILSVVDYLESLIDSDINSNVGVMNGEIDASPSNTVDLPRPGFIRPLTAAGNIKYTTINGETRVAAFDLKETSLVKVKRVWVQDTTATGIVVYY
jgi:hypothetical protein